MLPGAGTAAPEVVLADDAETGRALGMPAANLAEHPALAVPAFDPAALQPGRPPPRRSRRPLVGAGADPQCGRGAGTRGALARLAARGMPAHLEAEDSALRDLLAAPLYACLRTDPGGMDPAGRALHRIEARRLAHRHHSAPARVRQIRAAAGLPPDADSRVSVLLVTRRPAWLGHALASVARQNHPDLELVLGLHGDGFEENVVAREVARLRLPTQVVRIGGEASLGAALNAASAAARGPLLTKMDDDDVYGADHVADLVQARDYSGAHLVGKDKETVYVAAKDCTFGRAFGPGERYFRHVNGGTLLIGKADLEHLGPWRDAASGVDTLLIRDVMRGGGLVYRTHGAGYVYVRHGVGHTSASTRRHRERAAGIVVPGWRPELAGEPAADLPPLVLAGRGEPSHP